MTDQPFPAFDPEVTTSTSDDGKTRRLEYAIEVEGTPEEVWQAIATGPGISSWYVPHTVTEEAGGQASASFGPEPEMTVPGRVVAWEPPHRVVFDGGEPEEGADPGMAFEWLVEAGDGGSCVVRLVNHGFGFGEEWDAQYEGMREGWRLFLRNLQLHLAHFRGRTATAVLPVGSWALDQAEAWKRLCAGLGVPEGVAPGDRVSIGAEGTATLTGTVVDAESWRLALLLDGPVDGTALLAAEGVGSAAPEVSIWCYLYGDEGKALAPEVDAGFRAWLADQAAT